MDLLSFAGSDVLGWGGCDFAKTTRDNASVFRAMQRLRKCRGGKFSEFGCVFYKSQGHDIRKEAFELSLIQLAHRGAR